MAGMLNIFDMDQFTKEFIKKCINETNPDVDTSDDSAFNDVFIEPLTPIIKKLIEIMTGIEFKSSIAYSSVMSEEDLDFIGENNYFIERLQGSSAKGTEIFIFNNVSNDTKIIIPSGVVLTDADETVNFVTTQKITILPEELSSYYSSETMDYRVPVPIIAMYPGSEYNKAAGVVTKCLTPVSSLLTGVTNVTAITGGTDKETNEEYANRMSTFYSSQHLGQYNGYVRDIKETNPAITDVKVVGKGDIEMTRDRINILDESVSEYNDDGTITIKAQDSKGSVIVTPVEENGEITGYKVSGDFLKRVGYGGKVDIYIKGSDFTAISDTITAQTPVYDLDIEIPNIPYTDKINEATVKFKLTVSETGKELTYYSPRDFNISENPPVQFVTAVNGAMSQTGAKYVCPTLYKATSTEAIGTKGDNVPESVNITLDNSSVTISPKEKALKTSEQEQIGVGIRFNTNSGTSSHAKALIAFTVENLTIPFIAEYSFDNGKTTTVIKYAAISTEGVKDGSVITTSESEKIFFQIDKRGDVAAAYFCTDSSGTNYNKICSFNLKNTDSTPAVQIQYLKSEAAETGKIFIEDFYTLKSSNERNYRTFNVGDSVTDIDVAKYSSFIDNEIADNTVSDGKDYSSFDTSNNTNIRFCTTNHQNSSGETMFKFFNKYINIAFQPSSWETTYPQYYKKSSDKGVYIPVTASDAFIFAKDKEAKFNTESKYYERTSSGVFFKTTSANELAWNNGLYYLSNFEDIAGGVYVSPGIDETASGKLSMEFAIQFNKAYEFMITNDDSITSRLSLLNKESDEFFYINIASKRESSGKKVTAAEGLGLSDAVGAITGGISACQTYLSNNGIPYGDIEDNKSSLTNRVRAASIAFCTDKIGNLIRGDVYDLLINYYHFDLGMVEYKSITELKNLLYTAVYPEVSTFIEYMAEDQLKKFAEKVSSSLSLRITDSDTAAAIRKKIKSYLNRMTIHTGSYVRVSKDISVSFEPSISATNQDFVADIPTALSMPVYIKTVLDFSSYMYSLYIKYSEDDDYSPIGTIAGFPETKNIVSFKMENSYTAQKPSIKQIESSISVSDIIVKYYEKEQTEPVSIKVYSSSPFADDMPEKISQGYTVVHDEEDSDRAVMIIKDDTYAEEYTLNYSYDDGTGYKQDAQIVFIGCSAPVKNTEDAEVFRYDIVSPANDLYSIVKQDSDNTETPIDINYKIDGDTYILASIAHKSSDGKDLSSEDFEYNSNMEFSKLEMPLDCALRICTTDDYSSVYKALPYVNNNNLVVSYNANNVLSDIAEKYRNNRLVTADVLIKEAARTYVNIKMNISTGLALTTVQKSEIISAIKTFIDSQPIEGEIQQSDLINFLYQDYRTQQYVDYIELPLKNFYASDEIPERFSDESYNVLSAASNTYFYLGKCVIGEIGSDAEGNTDNAEGGE